MSKKRRFASRGFSWSNGIVTLDRVGREFDVDAERDLIQAILRSGVYDGGHVLELPTVEELSKSAAALFSEQAAFAQTIQTGVVEALPVTPLDGKINEELELQAIAEEERLRREQAQEDLQKIAERKATREKIYGSRRESKPKNEKEIMDKPKSETKKRRATETAKPASAEREPKKKG